MVTKSQGTKLAKDGLMGRVFEASLGDLKANAEDDAFRKFKLRVEEVQGTNCLTNFYGMDLSSDKLRSLVRKWHSLIEAYADVKTTDGYLLRMYCIGFTKRRPNQVHFQTHMHTSEHSLGTRCAGAVTLDHRAASSATPGRAAILFGEASPIRQNSVAFAI